MNRHYSWLFVCVVALVFGFTPSAAADDPLARLVELTNLERQQAGLAPLVPNPQLAQAAQTYAEVLASGDCWAHACGPVPDFAQRAVNAGYAAWTYLGENLAAGHRTPEAAVAAWMASPGHRANILNPSFTEIGVGRVLGGRSRIYWVQEFGARRGQPAAARVPAAPREQQPQVNTLAPPAAAAPEQAQAQGDGPGAAPQTLASCEFVLGFAALRAMVGPAAGVCLEDEHVNPASGDAEQRTTRGLFVWRQTDNWTAFTDGYRTWILGPYGLQQRLNSQRFVWEGE